MATPTILDFYRFTVPRGLNVKHRTEWTTTSSASLVITAASGRIYFIQGIEFYISPDASLDGNTLTITHSSDVFGGVNRLRGIRLGRRRLLNLGNGGRIGLGYRGWFAREASVPAWANHFAGGRGVSTDSDTHEQRRYHEEKG